MEDRIRDALNKCLNSNQRSIYLCLQDYTTNQDEIEIQPGLRAQVLVRGQKKGHGLQYLPTVAVVQCDDVCSALKAVQDTKDLEKKSKGSEQ